jgi:hypothetical protein
MNTLLHGLGLIILVFALFAFAYIDEMNIQKLLGVIFSVTVSVTGWNQYLLYRNKGEEFAQQRFISLFMTITFPIGMIMASIFKLLQISF